MTDPRPTDPDVTRHLDALGAELRARPSGADRITQRLHAAHMRAPVWPAPAGVAAAMLLFTAVTYFSPPAPRAQAIAARRAIPPNLQMDGITIVQYFAWLLDDRSVLVVWGYKDGDVGTPVKRTFDGYNEVPIRCDVAADGWATCWSVFVADDGRNPQLSPPMLAPWGTHEPPVRFGVTAGPYRSSELRDAIRYTRFTGRPLSMDELQNEIRRMGVEKNLQS